MASHPEAWGDRTQILHPAPGNTARLSLNQTSLKIALPGLYFAGWLDLQLNSHISTNHNSKAAILAKVSGESSLPKTQTKSYPSPPSAALVLQRESPTQWELSNPECLQASLWKGREQQQSIRPYPGACRGFTVFNQGQRFPTPTAPLRHSPFTVALLRWK